MKINPPLVQIHMTTLLPCQVLIVFLSKKRSVAILSYLCNNLLVDFLSCTSSNFILITVEMIIKIPFLMIKGWPTVFVLLRNLASFMETQDVSLLDINWQEAPWTATPGLIKIDGKGQSNCKLNVTNIDAIFRKTAQHKTQKAVFLFTGITGIRKSPFSDRKLKNPSSNRKKLIKYNILWYNRFQSRPHSWRPIYWLER